MKGKYYGDYFYNESRLPWYKKFKLDRRSVTTINRIRSGHNSLKNHLFRLNIINDDKCQCGSVESVDHIVFNCPLYNKQRKILIDFLKMKYRDIPKSVHTIINSKDHSIIDSFANFLKSINIYI